MKTKVAFLRLLFCGTCALLIMMMTNFEHGNPLKQINVVGELLEQYVETTTQRLHHEVHSHLHQLPKVMESTLFRALMRSKMNYYHKVFDYTTFGRSLDHYTDFNRYSRLNNLAFFLLCVHKNP
jgi:hypothetical protein